MKRAARFWRLILDQRHELGARQSLGLRQLGGDGAGGWSYAEILPYFRRAESFDKGANDYRGDKGPMLVETCKAEGPLYDAFIQSAKQAGMRHVEDHNAYRQEGVHITQRNVGKGIRWSSSQGYIHARGNQPNLDVVVGGRLLKINFSNRRATRADILVNGERQSVEIDGEIILCAGALNSPQLLQLSGIGPADMLRSVGIEVLADMPGVGAGLRTMSPRRCSIAPRRTSRPPGT